MQTQGLNLFIVDDNRSMVTALKQYLQISFGGNLQISTFSNGGSCLEKVDKQTDVVILDYSLEDTNGVNVLKSIKAINPKTEVIMLSNNQDLSVAVESFRAGATDYVVKGPSSWKKITRLINNIITAPIKLIAKEFGISKYMTMFLVTFVVMGGLVFSVLQALK